MIKKNIFRKTISVTVIALFVGACISITPNSFVDTVKAESEMLFNDDFEDDTFDKWTIISGDWEIISEDGNKVAHLKRSSSSFRRMVSKNTVTDYVTITAKVKGDCDPVDPCADMAVGFYSDSSGGNFYFVVLGRNDQLAIYRFENGVAHELVYNDEVISDDNIWYNVKIKLENGNINAKRWEDGSSEPSEWQISYSGATIYGHHLILGGLAGQSNEEFWFNDMLVTSDVNLNEGLVSYWSFDDGSGSTAEDSAGSNDGTLKNMNTSSCWVNGVSGYALDFDGEDDYVNVLDHDSLSFGDGYDDEAFTFTAWIKRDTVDVSHTILSKYNSYITPKMQEYSLGVNANDNDALRAYIWDTPSSTNCFVVRTQNAIDTGWHFVAATYTGDEAASNIKLYIDGDESSIILLDSSDYVAMHNTLISFKIGRSTANDGASSCFDGIIDEVRVYNRALSEIEIQQLYVQDGGSIPLEQGLVGYWSFDDGSGSTAEDSAGSNDGTLTNMDTSSCWVSGISGYALKFDGDNDFVDCGNDESLQITGDMTVSAWIKTEQDIDPGYIAAKGTDAGTTGNGWYLWVRENTHNNRIGIQDNAAGYNWDYRRGSTVIQTDEWYHVVGIFYADGSSRNKIYINGNEESVSYQSGGALSLRLDSGSPLTIGYPGYEGGSETNFNGIIDEVRIYNKALSGPMIKQLYDETGSGVEEEENFPITEILEPYDGDIFSGSQVVEISGTVIDDDVIDDREIYISINDEIFKPNFGSGSPGSNELSWAYWWDISDYNPGPYTISATYFDGECFGNKDEINVEIENSPPNKPSTPAGEKENLQTGIDYTYSTSTTDPDGDKIYYKFYWGEMEGETEWLGPYNSGETVYADHKWTAIGDYTIKVIAKDIHKEESHESGGLTVHVKQGNKRPTVDMKQCNPSNPDPNEKCKLTFVVVDDSYAANLEVDWGDGTKDSEPMRRIGYQMKFEHSWSAEDSYQLTLKSWDLNTEPTYHSALGITRITINVGGDNDDPICSIKSISPNPSVLNEKIWLTANADDPDGYIKTYKWYYKNNPKPFKTSNSKTCYYDKFPVGNHEIKLKVVDSSGSEVESSNTKTIRVVDGTIVRAPFSHQKSLPTGGYANSDKSGFSAAYAQSGTGVDAESYAGHQIWFNVNKECHVKFEARIHTRSECSNGDWSLSSGPSAYFKMFWDQPKENILPYTRMYQRYPYHDHWGYFEDSYNSDWISTIFKNLLFFLTLIPFQGLYDDVITAFGQIFFGLNSGNIDEEDILQGFNDEDSDAITLTHESGILLAKPRTKPGGGIYNYPNVIALLSNAQVLGSDSESAIASLLEYVLLTVSKSGPNSNAKITLQCPVDAEIYDPLDRVISKYESTIPNASYKEYIVEDNNKSDEIFIPNAIIGTYKIYITPEDGADPDDEYSIILLFGGENEYIIQNVTVSDIPDEPYLFEIRKPSTPTTPTAIDAVIGKTGNEYSFRTNSTHPDMKDLYYLWDWNDGNTSWYGPYNSSEICNASYTWEKPGFYNIRVKSRFAVNSSWSDNLTVLMLDGIPPVSNLQIGYPKYNESIVTSRTRFSIQAFDDYSDVNKTYYRMWHNNSWTPNLGSGLGINDSFMEYNDSFTLPYNGTYHIEFYSVDYSDNVENINNRTFIVDNIPPEIVNLILPIDLVSLGGVVNLECSFFNNGSSCPLDAVVDWGDGNISFCTVDHVNQSINDSWNYAEPGVYTIDLLIIDELGLKDSEIYQYIVVYDPSAGFVTGGGWIMSPKGAYTPDPSLTGKANFGFVSKYKKGQQDPVGNTEFQFKTADMNFHSDSYEWLVIAGAKAMYKGTGTINGEGNYGFMLSAIDEDLTPSTDVDLFRIKIWDKDNDDTVVYDNQLGEDEDADPTTEIGGGQIKIHNG